MPERPRILWIGVEPTPYFVDEFTELESSLPYRFEFFFLAAAHTQPWQLHLGRVLSRRPGEPVDLLTYAAFLFEVCLDPPDAVVLEGYGLPHFVLSAWLFTCTGVPWVLRSDTPQRDEKKRRCLDAGVLSWIVRHATWMLPGGTRQMQNLVRAGGDPAKIAIGYMTVREDRFPRVANTASSPAGTLRAVSVGRLIRRKRVDAAIDSVLRLSREGLAVGLEIIGDGPELESLRRRAEASGGRIEFLGFCEQDGVAAALARAEVFVLLSESEPWGLVVNEALAVGLPLVLERDIGCARDLLSDGVNGFAVDVAKPETIDAALRVLALDPQIRRRMSASSSEISADWSSSHRLAAVGHALAVVTGGAV